jgi:hypothetical protein
MDRIPEESGWRTPQGIVRRPVTFPVRRSEGTVYVTVPVDWPERIRHQGKMFRPTGKLGHRVSDKTQAAEYEAVDGEGRRTGERLWLLDNGTRLRSDYAGRHRPTLAAKPPDA